MSQFDGRWHPPLTTDIEKLEDLGNDLAAFGELDGDHPPKADRQDDEVGTLTLSEVLEQYETDRAQNITIINPEDE
jgi:hypothetical protein